MKGPRVSAVVVVSVASLVLAACGGDGDESSSSASDCDSGAQVVRIEALDTPRFDPDSVTVKAGQPVCFVVTNAGETDHEFVVGDQEMQDEHEQEMASASMEMSSSTEMSSSMSMGGMPELEVEPGETASATVSFDEPGQMLYACHEPGHYAAGMVGTITITS